MPRAVLLVLTLPLACGCQALVRNAEGVTYRPGTPPGTTTAKADATFTLYAPEPDAMLGYATVDLTKGTTVGFRREPDGSLVAIAGERTTPIPDDRAIWRYTPKPLTHMDRFAVAVRDKCEIVVGFPLLLALLLIHPEIAGQL